MPPAEEWLRLPWAAPTMAYRLDNSKKTVNADEVSADLPVLRLFMSAAYIGWDFQECRGWNWDAFFEGWASYLRANAGRTLSVAEAFSTLRALPLDNHSGPALESAGLMSPSRTAYTERPLAAPAKAIRNREGRTFALDSKDPAQFPRPCWLFDPPGELRQVSAVSYPARLGEIGAVLCGDAWIPVRLVDERPPASAGEKPGFHMIGQGVGYLRLPTLSPANCARLLRWTEWIPASARELGTLIVDLRGNGGGEYGPALPLLQALTGGAQFPPCTVTCRLESPLTALLTWGAAQAGRLAKDSPSSPEIRERLQYALDRLFSPPSSCREFIRQPPSWGYAEHSFPGRAAAGQPSVIVLIDHRCGSDGEALAYMLASLPGSTVAGSNSFGVAQFTNPGYFVLPHSRIPYRLAMGQSDIYGDGRSFDGYGLNADVLLATRESQRPEHLPALIAAVQRVQYQTAG